MTEYRYHRLSLCQIRLLTLLSVDQSIDEPICVSISPVTLSQRPRYTAISYRWGTPTLAQKIHCCNDVLFVTPNLHSALRQLRAQSLVGEEIVLWLDAVSINQQDDIEKIARVLLMGEIYKAASRVVIWLGPEAYQSDLAMAWARYLADEATDQAVPPDASSRLTPFRFKDYPIDPHVSPKSFFCLLSRPWFRRVWTI
ncbi:heterokaryon incompatibility protein-domain-containing protein [Lineolata rhizophorae]|uniref:Heterokaryon incompatibility protein-domain-containing protein n=1 Tax=Lineolata rhizophorae TaxID=578093 RepID=A0A6A6NVY4_9PEZI|nr:heterokaryon incompatibility protein-domain-containing protein [Lineolata rhizophorae]